MLERIKLAVLGATIGLFAVASLVIFQPVLMAKIGCLLCADIISVIPCLG